MSRFDEDEVIPEAHKAEAYAKLVRLCGEYGIEVSRKGNPKNELLKMKMELNKRKSECIKK